MWDHDEALEWLYGRQRLGIKLGLDKVRDLMAAIGDPQQAFASVHVAGTNGKGSVTRLVAEALRRAGHRTGSFTSPHLVHFTERIEAHGAPILPEEVATGLAVLRPAVERLDLDGRPPTFFEVNTALAFHHFRQKQVEWAVVETGLGGRLDATNVLQPRLTVVTNVTMEHQQFLGADLETIAAEKAGILKPGVPCVTGAEGPALRVLKQTSQALQVPMSVLGEDYHVVPDINGLRLLHPRGEAHYQVAMAGHHQLHNAGLAVAACDALRNGGVAIPPEAVQQALATTRLPGRLESFHIEAQDLALDAAQPERHVEVLLDGAHNEAGAAALRWHLGRRDLTGFQLVVGFNADKPWQGMLDQWSPLAARVHAVPVRSPRTVAPHQISDHMAGGAIPCSTWPDVRAALGDAACGDAGLILVAGSLYLVGEARAVLTGQGLEEIRGGQ